MRRAPTFAELPEQIRNEILHKLAKRITDEVDADGQCVVIANTSTNTPDAVDEAKRQLELFGYDVKVEGIVYTFRRRGT